MNATVRAIHSQNAMTTQSSSWGMVLISSRREQRKCQRRSTMLSREVRTLIVSVAVAAAITAGCSKRPVSVEVPSAPAAAGQSQAPEAVKERAQPVVPLGEITSGPGERPGAAVAAPETPVGSERPAPSEFVTRDTVQDVYFDFDRYDIRPGDARILDA